MFEKKEIEKELALIDKRLESQENWEDHILLNQDLKRKNYLDKFLNSISTNEKNLFDTKELLRISELSNDKSLVEELNKELDKINLDLNKLYLETLMNGKAD